MRKTTFLVALAAIALVLVPAAVPAFATPILTITPSISSLTLTEGDGGSFTFTITNTSGSTVFVSALGTYIDGTPVGDFSDIPTLTVTGGCLYNYLGSGASCIETATINPSPLDVGEPVDSAIARYYMSGSVGFSSDIAGKSDDVAITVKDPSERVPEPSAAMLLFPGVLFLGSLRKRFLARDRTVN